MVEGGNLRAPGIEGDRVEERFIQGECLDRSQVSRALYCHMVPGANQDFADKVKALLRPVGDQDLIR